MDFDVKQVAQELAPVVNESVKSEVAESTKTLDEAVKNLEAEVLTFKDAIAQKDANTDEKQSQLAKSAIV